jgi:hypothetical protein
MAASIVPYSEGLTFAVGVDSPSGEARNVAVTGSPAASEGGGDVIDYTMTLITSVDDLMTTLGISKEASGGVGLFSASALMEFAKSCSINTSSVFACFAIKVRKAFEQIDAPGVTDAANTLLANGQVSAFQDQFGDMFVRGLERGGQFFGVIEVKCTDQSDQQSVSVQVGGAFGPFSASGEFSQSFKDTVSNHQTHVNSHIEGGQVPQVLPTSLQAMMDTASSWPHTVDANPVPYTALLDSYSILPLANPPNYIDLQNQKDVLALCAQARNQHWLWINDIAYILAHSDQFVSPDLAKLGQLQLDLEADLTTIAEAASNALNNPKEAAAPAALKVTAVDLPARIKSSATDLHPFYGDWLNHDTAADLTELLITRINDATVSVNGTFGSAGVVSADGAWDSGAEALTVSLVTSPGGSGGGMFHPGTSHTLAVTAGNAAVTELTVVDTYGTALNSNQAHYTFQPKPVV